MPKLAESLKNKEFAGCVGIPGIGLEDIAGKRRSTAWEAGYIYAASRFFWSPRRRRIAPRLQSDVEIEA